MIRSTGLAPWEFEFPFPGSLTSTFLYRGDMRGRIGVRRDHHVRVRGVRDRSLHHVRGALIHVPPYTLNPKPSTLNPKPQTLNPRPQTLNPEP